MDDRAAFGLMALVVLAGCGGGSSLCVVGESISCACTDGRTGAQVCQADGTFGACACTGAGEDAGRGSADAGPQIDAGPPGPLRVFVTSLAYRPSALGDVCQNTADAQGLGGSWVAWLSRRYPDPTPDADAIDEITGAGPWLRLDGQMAFRNRAQLATLPSVPINVTEANEVLAPGLGVWTGTLLGGTTGDHDCQRWSENIDLFSGVVGSADSTDNWTDVGLAACDNTRRVYCFEQ